jgi:integrase
MAERLTNRLTPIKIENAKPDPAKPKGHKLMDGNGLHIFVSPAGGKLWRYTYEFAGTAKVLSLGAYDRETNGVAKARAARDAAKAQVKDGVDPKDARETDRRAREVEAAKLITFAEGWTRWRDKNAARLSFHRMGAYDRGFRHCAKLHDKVLAALTPTDIIAVLTQLRTPKAEGGAGYKSATVMEARNVIKRAVGQAVLDQVITINPLDGVTASGFTLENDTEHLPAAIEAEDLADVLRRVAAFKGLGPMSRLLNLLPYVLTRPSELRLAKWEEFDLDAALWIVPKARLKTRRHKQTTDHQVPLAHQVVARLRQWHAAANPAPGDYVFPGRLAGKPLDRCSAARAMTESIGMAGVQTAHGFRASASSRLTASKKWSIDAIEKQLSHIVKKDANRKVRMAYMREELMSERADMLQWWADMIDALRAGAPDNVVGIGSAAKPVTVKVDDRDRQAAADWLRGAGIGQSADAIERGDFDDHSLVQLLARHRAEATAADRAAA